MIDFLSLAKKRFSARKYLEKKVEKEKILQILEAARVAPSAVNLQPIHIYVFNSDDKLDQIKSCYKRDWIKTAQVLMVITGKNNEAWHHPTSKKSAATIDASIVIDHITLAATALGLATCWVCNFDIKKCSDLLSLPTEEEPIAILPLGYTDIEPDTNRHINGRKKIEELVTFI